MSWRVLIEMTMEHEYYLPNMPPVTVLPSDPRAFGRAGLLLRQSGAQVVVLAEEEADDLPVEVVFDIEVRNQEVITLTRDADWRYVPQIHVPLDVARGEIDASTASNVQQAPGQPRLAQVTVVLGGQDRRDVTLRFSAMASHWAYHVIGPGSADVVIEDPEGEILFDALGTVNLPDGTPAQVIRSRAALPARARPGQRFSLSRPGPFGPRTVIPVLPAPQPLFAEVPGPDGAGAIIQSDIYVSIF